jgi:hypothetical protein
LRRQETLMHSAPPGCVDPGSQSLQGRSAVACGRATAAGAVLPAQFQSPERATSLPESPPRVAAAPGSRRLAAMRARWHARASRAHAPGAGDAGAHGSEVLPSTRDVTAVSASPATHASIRRLSMSLDARSSSRRCARAGFRARRQATARSVARARAGLAAGLKWPQRRRPGARDCGVGSVGVP